METTLDMSLLENGISIEQLLCRTSLAISMAEARSHTFNGIVQINGVPVDSQTMVDKSFLMDDNQIVIQRGKKAIDTIKFV